MPPWYIPHKGKVRVPEWQNRAPLRFFLATLDLLVEKLLNATAVDTHEMVVMCPGFYFEYRLS